jgi:hypothetical protein
MVCLTFLTSEHIGKGTQSISKVGYHRVNFLTPSDWKIKRMMVDRGYLWFSIGSKPRGRPGILHIPKVIYFVEVKGSICEQKNLHINLTKDQTQKPLKGSQYLPKKYLL